MPDIPPIMKLYILGFGAGALAGADGGVGDDAIFGFIMIKL